MADASERIEVAYVGVVVTLGIAAGVAAYFGLTFGYTETIMVSALLFGLIESPRLQQENEAVRILLMSLVILDGVLYVQFRNPSIISEVALTVLVLLFFGSVATTIGSEARSSGTIAKARTHAERNAPYYMFMGGLAALSVI